MSQQPEPGGEAKVDPALQPIEEQPGLPRVLLVGDSISIGYTLPVRARLAGRANVLRPLFNCGPSNRGVERHAEIVGVGGWDVIHFNYGLHDLKLIDGAHQVPLDAYAGHLRTLARGYLAAARKVIWCSTTPVPEGALSPPRRAGDVAAYNEAAQAVMAELKIPTHDLFAFAAARLERIQRPLNVHFTDAGSAELAESVVAAIGL
ncbi:MAG: SGNH/GDSL hydrolase family protein [Planctomycetes bacterium]|nr:SGNH/GDSL hydrolase family protein [Planctomycetota bacterium]